MWQDLREPVEPVKFKFKKGVTTILDNNRLRLEIDTIESDYISIRIGDSTTPIIRIGKESAKRLSQMFFAMSKELEEEEE